MKVFYSGGFPYFTPKAIDDFYKLGIYRRLFSYPFIEGDPAIRQGFLHIVEGYVGKGYEIMMDSGAFTVAKKDVKIDINKYAEFLLKYKDSITISVNLDIIVKGHKTPQALEKAAQEGWENLKFLES